MATWSKRWPPWKRWLLRRYFPTSGASEALCLALGMDARAVGGRAGTLGLARPALCIDCGTAPPLPCDRHRRCGRCDYARRAARRAFRPAPTDMDLDQPVSAAEERRRARARQLAEGLQHGPRGLASLRLEGWLPSAVKAVVEESPDWFQGTEDGLGLTAEGRLVLLGEQPAPATPPGPSEAVLRRAVEMLQEALAACPGPNKAAMRQEVAATRLAASEGQR